MSCLGIETKYPGSFKGLKRLYLEVKDNEGFLIIWKCTVSSSLGSYFRETARAPGLHSTDNLLYLTIPHATARDDLYGNHTPHIKSSPSLFRVNEV